MELKSVEMCRSPERGGRVRLAGQVSYDGGAVPDETYWFEVDESYEPYVNRTGDPWLVCLLPVAVTLGEPLRIRLPVDAGLYESVQELMRLWHFWYPHLPPVMIEAETVAGATSIPPGMIPGGMTGGTRRAVFFSGGVDSFFSVVRHESELDSETRIPIDDLLFVWGLDIPLSNEDVFQRMAATLRAVAQDLGKNLVDVATNIRETRFGEAEWGGMAHGCALVSVAHVLGGLYGSVLVPSSYPYRHPVPWGSNPLSDPLLSSSQTRVIHDGAAWTREEKTEYLADHELAARSLHVCWAGGSDQNCCECIKCYRTMTTLEALGVLDRFSTFQAAPFELAKLRNILWSRVDKEVYAPSIRSLAERNGRSDIVRALDASVKRGNAMERWRPKVWKLRRFRALVPIADRIEEAMLRDLVVK